MLRHREMGARTVQDLIVWQLARDLERRVVAFTATYPACDDFEYCRQIRQSAASAPRNIAEGFGRFLPGDFARFVRTARGSLEETRDHLDAGHERGYLGPDQHMEMRNIAARALGAATRLAVYLDATAVEWKKKGLRRPPNREP